MKILFHTSEKSEAMNTRILLEGKGIPVFIGNENSGSSMLYVTADNYTVWIPLDSQHEDAVNLLKNPSYKVSHPVDVSEFYRKWEETKITQNNSMNPFLLGASVLSIIVILLIGYLIFYREGL